MIGLPFVVVRGPALAGKTTVARLLAERLPGRTAVISEDALWGAIVTHDESVAAEADLVYRQMRLLASSYVRGGYGMVVDGSFALYRDGAAVLHESDLRDLLSLVSTVPNVRPLLVSLTAPLEALLARVGENERWDAAGVEAVHRAFESAMRAPVILDTSILSPDETVERILVHLGAA